MLNGFRDGQTLRADGGHIRSQVVVLFALGTCSPWRRCVQFAGLIRSFSTAYELMSR